MHELSVFDLVMFFVILCLTFSVTLFGRQRAGGDGALEYFLMGRRLTLPLFVATLVATWYGGIFGVTEIVFRHGLYGFLTQGLFWYVSYLVFAVFLASKVRRSQALSLPDLIEKKFGSVAGSVVAVINCFDMLPISYVMSCGLFLHSVFQVPYETGMVLGTTFVTCYAMCGGFRAVVYSDLLQFIVMMLSVMGVVWFSWLHMPFNDLQDALPSNHLTWSSTESFAEMCVWLLLAMKTLVNPAFYQRCLAAKSEAVARFGVLLSVMMWCVFDVCTCLGSLYARVKMPDALPSSAYLEYSLSILPSGMRGFFLAGIFATIVSTMDSNLLITADTLKRHLWRQSYLTNKLALAMCALASVGMAFFFDASIKKVWKTLGSLNTGALLLPMVLIWFQPKWLSSKAFLSMIFSGMFGVLLLHFLHAFSFCLFIPPIYGGFICSAGVGLLCATSFRGISV